MSTLPPDFKPSLWTRLWTWRKHRRVHRDLQGLLMQVGEHGGTLRCVHCGRTWRKHIGAGSAPSSAVLVVSGAWLEEDKHPERRPDARDPDL